MAYAAMDIYELMKTERIDEISGIINSLSIMSHLFRLKSYSYSKAMKVDFLVFLLSNYEKTLDENFKRDLLRLLIAFFDVPDVRKLFDEKQVVMELKYRTNIQRLEDLVQRELIDPRPANDPIYHPNPNNREKKSWRADFPQIESIPMVEVINSPIAILGGVADRGRDDEPLEVDVRTKTGELQNGMKKLVIEFGSRDVRVDEAAGVEDEAAEAVRGDEGGVPGNRPGTGEHGAEDGGPAGRVGGNEQEHDTPVGGDPRGL